MRQIILYSILIFSTVQILPQNFSAGISAGLGTSVVVYPYPTADNSILKNKTEAMKQSVSPVFFLEYRLNREFSFLVLVQYLRAELNDKFITAVSDNQTVSVSTDESVESIPFELNIQYRLPVSTDEFQIAIYSGLGIYPSRYKREAGTLSSNSTAENNHVGLVAGVNTHLRIYRFINWHLDIRFRDPDIYFLNIYQSTIFTIQEKSYRIQQEKFNTRVNFNGLYFITGVKFLL